MRYDTKKRVFMVNNYQKFKNIASVQRAWRTQFKNQKAPSRSAILTSISKFENTGTVDHIPRKTFVPSKKREAAQIEVKKLILEKPSLSINKLSVAAGISYGTTRSILRDDLKLKPYKLQAVHQLDPQNYAKRVKFAKWFLSLPDVAIDQIIFSDETFFCLTESLNKQNNRLWLDSRPNEQLEVPLHDEKILVWCAISAEKIFGPYYFEETVNQHNYLEIIKTFFWPKLLRTPNYKKYWFQQDGAPPHTANLVQDWLTSKLSTKFINKSQWPPQSPDLSPCDFFLWGYLKSVVYNPLPKSIEELKANLEKEIKKINKDILKSTFLNIKKDVF